jgi:hypothetical protein
VNRNFFSFFIIFFAFFVSARTTFRLFSEGYIFCIFRIAGTESFSVVVHYSVLAGF